MITASPHGPIGAYLPHRPPMLFIDDVLEVTSHRIVCSATIRDDCIFSIDGRVHPSAMIEFVAQACAAGVGVLAARDGNPPRLGFIMGCREIAFATESFAVGDQLTITADKAFGQTNVAAFSCSVVRAGVRCATIQMSVIDADAAVGASAAGEAP